MSTAYKPPVRIWNGVSTETIIVSVSDIVSYIVKITGTATVNVDYTLEPFVQGNLTADGAGTLVFADTNPDTLTRSKGSWIADRFAAGMTVAITGTTSNNASYLINTVTEDTITFDGAVTVTAETITDSSGVVMVADIPAASWLTDHVVTDAAGSEFVSIEWGPTGIKFNRATGAGTVDIWVKS